MLESKIDTISKFNKDKVLTSGAYNQIILGNYDDTKSVLKIWNKNISDYLEHFNNELEVYKNKEILSKPGLLYYNSEDNYLILKFVNGKLLNNLIQDNNMTLIKGVVTTIKSIHALENSNSYLSDYFNLIRKNIENKFSKLENTDARVTNALMTHYNKLIEFSNGYQDKIKLCRVHGDFNDTNIILTKDNTYLIDWEHSHIGNKYLDIAHICNKDDEFSKEFLKLYFSDEKLEGQLYNFFLNLFLLKISLNFLSDKNKLSNKHERKALIVKNKLERILSMQGLSYNLDEVVNYG